MKKSKFTEAQIAFELKQSETGTGVEEICRKLGISQATFFNWKKKYGGLGVSELRRLRQNWFLNLEDAREKIKDWRWEYNHFRPHSSLDDYLHRNLLNCMKIRPETLLMTVRFKGRTSKYVNAD